MVNRPPLHSFRVGHLAVEIHSHRNALAHAAAEAVVTTLRALLREQVGARVIFACAPSQDEFLAALVLHPDVAWDRITAFHMDEYVGLRPDHPASFRHYLRQHLTARVTLRQVHELAGDATHLGVEAERYTTLLAAAPIDLVCLGIGENGHLAFNDPPVADFCDPLTVKPVALDPACRQQQVNDGCFTEIALVPTHALTLTIPALLGARRVIGVVPGPRKAAAVHTTIHGPVARECPASALRTHARSTLFLDAESASDLDSRH